MLDEFKYLLVEFYDGESHLCELFKTMEDVGKILEIHRSTIYKNYDKKSKNYVIKKNKKKYYIKKIN